ncbi:hypothetical protein KP509_05G073000 [Ceratopteris richardii]|uniref:Uncharacterized protein n=1 Tax=Ceratopteris richardii TaxID=49495 RepID=A0A8T2UUK6_CERRI|nr:hypothetical protein KP509_05G073000 [Ceratopteris richardii]
MSLVILARFAFSYRDLPVEIYHQHIISKRCKSSFSLSCHYNISVSIVSLRAITEIFCSKKLFILYQHIIITFIFVIVRCKSSFSLSCHYNISVSIVSLRAITENLSIFLSFREQKSFFQIHAGYSLHCRNQFRN